jgi:flagellar hook protein FlgE
MASEVSTIQSLKAVDAWIDVINANINGGVRTAFKSTRLKFGGSNVDITRAGTTTSSPLQFPEPGLTTANTVIDFSQGAITASTENAHLAIQGEGFFVLIDSNSVATNGGMLFNPATTKFVLTRDGEFRTNQNGHLVHTASGYVLMTGCLQFVPPTALDGNGMRAVYNNLDMPANAAGQASVRLTDFLANNVNGLTTILADGVSTIGYASQITSILKLGDSKQRLRYTSMGSTIYDFGYSSGPTLNLGYATTSDATLLSKSLEASNASMTQSVPELSLAQKLFSALTKVLQTRQTNVDGVLNLVR